MLVKIPANCDGSRRYPFESVTGPSARKHSFTLFVSFVP